MFWLLLAALSFRAVDIIANPKIDDSNRTNWQPALTLDHYKRFVTKREDPEELSVISLVKTLKDDGGEVKMNISLVTGGCNRVKDDTVAGTYTFSNGTMMENVTVGDIDSDLNEIQRQSPSRRLAGRALANHTLTLAKQILSMSQELEARLSCKQTKLSDATNNGGNDDGGVAESSGALNLHDEFRRRNLLWNEAQTDNVINYGITMFAAAVSGVVSGVYIRYWGSRNTLYNEPDYANVLSYIETLKQQSLPIPQSLVTRSRYLHTQYDRDVSIRLHAALNGAWVAVFTTIVATQLVPLLKLVIFKKKEALAVAVAIADIRRQLEDVNERLDDPNSGVGNNAGSAAAASLSALLSAGHASTHLTNVVTERTAVATTRFSSPSSTSRMSTSPSSTTPAPTPSASTAANTCFTPKSMADLFMRAINRGWGEVGGNPQSFVAVPGGAYRDIDLEQGISNVALDALIAVCRVSSG